jgi:sphingomyelin phosphodiesterase acid-like 3
MDWTGRSARGRMLLPWAIALWLAFAGGGTLSAQKAAPAVPALFISDVHYDPLRDPALARRLNAAPESEWPAILASPPSATIAEDYAAVQKACPTRGYDPDQALWQSTLAALRTRAADSRFAVLSGDLLPHNFECRYQFVFPTASHADYLNFTLNTLRYVVDSLRATLPGIPLYVALGNNDTACTGNSLDPDNDFLHLAAKVIAEALPPADRNSVLHGLAAGGYYSVPLAPLRHTRLLVVDNLFFLTEYTTCAKKKDYSEETAQISWLNAQLALAHRRHEKVWVVGHIPPGVSLYTTFLNHKKICDGDPPAMSLHSEQLAAAIGSNADIVRLAIFAHTHSDAFGLITPTLGDPGPSPPRLGKGVPMKVVASVSAINGNNPSFTLAQVDPATAKLIDYSVIESSNLTGVGATWSKQYTYSEDYAEPDFSARSLVDLIAKFSADPKS